MRSVKANNIIKTYVTPQGDGNESSLLFNSATGYKNLCNSARRRKLVSFKVLNSLSKIKTYVTPQGDGNVSNPASRN